MPTPPPFDPAYYENGAEVVALLAGVGPDKPFPPQLLDSSPPLAKEDAAAIWTEYLTNTRVVVMNPVTRKIVRVQDFCGRQTGTYQFDTGWLEGFNFAWRFETGEYDLWNTPKFRLLNVPDFTAGHHAGATGLFDARFLPARNAEIRVVETTGKELPARVLSHPACTAVQSVLQVSAAQWRVFRLGELRHYPAELRPGSPRLDQESLVRAWTEFLGQTTWFMNLNHMPALLTCRDGTGIAVGRYESQEFLGEPFTWEVRDARTDVTWDTWPTTNPRAGREDPNTVWLLLTFPHLPANPWQPDAKNFPYRVLQLLNPAAFVDEQRGTINVDNPGCSPEAGLQYLKESGILDLRCRKNPVYC